MPRPLRRDLEWVFRTEANVELRDPRREALYALDVAELRVAEAFDGARTARAVARALGLHDPDEGGARLVAEVAAAFEARQLLDTPAARHLRPAPGAARARSVLRPAESPLVGVEAEPGARFACHACGHCCRGFVVELRPDEEARIERALYADVLGGIDPVESCFVSASEPARRVLRHRAEPSRPCVFLADDGRCWIHARQGPAAKPDACQAFPLTVVDVPRGPSRLGLRVACRSLGRSFETGPPLASEEAAAARLFARVPRLRVPSRARWLGRSVGFATLDATLGAIRATLEAKAVSPAALREVDRGWLDGRVARARRRFGRALLSLVDEARARPDPAPLDGLEARLEGLPGGFEALRAMWAGRAPPPVDENLARFLGVQLGHVLHAFGPAQAPDVGLGLVALLLGAEATLHVLGPGERSLDRANHALDVFTSPVLELPDDGWPILRAIEPRYTAARMEES